MSEQTLRLFVSSPGDVAGERHRIDLVVERLNAEFAGRVRIETVRWERSYYSAHDTFQRQIPEAGECDVVVAVFRGRLGTPLPPEFQRLPDGEPYPSGTAYEVLSAIEVRKAGKRVPDVYVFRYPDAPSVGLDAPDRADIEAQWTRLKAFFDRWFRTETGQFVAAFQTYVSTDDFAVKVEDCLRQWLAQRGYLAQGPVWDRVLLGSPFPGLAAFDANRGAVFFGRDMAIGQAVARLREAEAPGRAPFLMVLGASGAGKSSLLRAGLLPRLLAPGTIPEVDLWRPAVMTPGADPFAALADALFDDAALGRELRAGTFRTRELLARQLAGDPALAAAPLRDALERAAAQRQAEAGFTTLRPARLLLGIDQAERLFTEAAPEVAAAAGTLLATLVRGGLATVIVVLRSDAYARFQAVDALVALREDGATLDVLPPAAAELEQIVTRPVAACVPPLAFDPGLAARLVADARGGDALPLLQVSLARLYAAEAGRGDGVLGEADYRGMDAAVTETANDALATLDTAAQAELPALVAGLVADVATDPRTGVAVPVVAALDRTVFEAGRPARAALVEAFVAKRLLTAEGRGERQLVRPVHEALLRIWPQAVAILADTAALIRVRRSLEPLARAWAEAEESAKPAHLDLSPALLDGADGLLARFGADLPPHMADFITQAAAADAARRDRERAEQEQRVRDAEALAAARRRAAQRTGVGLAAAIVLAGLAGWQWHEAGEQRDRAQRSLTLATGTANGLVADLAHKFRDTVGIPAAMVRDILDRAQGLQTQLLASGEVTPALRGSQADALVESSLTLMRMNEAQHGLEAAAKGRGILQTLVAANPGDIDLQRRLAAADERVGDAHQLQGDHTAALASYNASLVEKRQVAAADPSNVTAQHEVALMAMKIGNMELQRDDLDAAIASYQVTLSIAERLAQATPDDPERQHDIAIASSGLAASQQLQGDLPNALKSYQRTHDILERLSKAHPEDGLLAGQLAAVNDYIGDVQVGRGNRLAASLSYLSSLVSRKQLAAADPSSSALARDVATSLTRVGQFQLGSGNSAKAMQNLQEALDIQKRLIAKDPANVFVEHDITVTYAGLGVALLNQGKVDEARTSVQAAHEIVQRLAAADPGNGVMQREVAGTDMAVGNVERAAGKLDVALASYREAATIIGRLAAAAPRNMVLQRELMMDYQMIATTEMETGDVDAAMADLRAGRAATKTLLDILPNNAGLKSMLAWYDRRIPFEDQ